MLQHQPPSNPSLAGTSISLVGPGRVGSSLATWAHSLGARIDLIAGRDRDERSSAASANALDLAATLGGRAVRLEDFESNDSGLVILSVLDPVLAETAQRLAERMQAPIVLHTSGSVGSEILAPLRDQGCAVGSLHPLRAFPKASLDPTDAHRTFFAVGGDPAAVECAGRLALAFGGTSGEIRAEQRPIYHLLASIAAGGVVTLVAMVEQLAEEIGLPDSVAAGYLALARGALDAVDERVAFADSITGPLARGDSETFLEEIDSLINERPEGSAQLELIARLALETVRLQSSVRTPVAADASDRTEAWEQANEPAEFDKMRSALETALLNRGILDRL